jgi:hypothetical protein
LNEAVCISTNSDYVALRRVSMPMLPFPGHFPGPPVTLPLFDLAYRYHLSTKCLRASVANNQGFSGFGFEHEPDSASSKDGISLRVLVSTVSWFDSASPRWRGERRGVAGHSLFISPQWSVSTQNYPLGIERQLSWLSQNYPHHIQT